MTCSCTYCQVMFQTYRDLSCHAIERHSWMAVCGSTYCWACREIFTTFQLFQFHCSTHHQRPPHQQPIPSAVKIEQPPPSPSVSAPPIPPTTVKIEAPSPSSTPARVPIIDKSPILRHLLASTTISAYCFGDTTQ